MTHYKDSIALSSEYNLHETANGTEPLQFFRNFDCEPNVLLFTRNPLTHIMLAYSQAVKREEFRGTIDEFVACRDYRSSIHTSLVHSFSVMTRLAPSVHWETTIELIAGFSIFSLHFSNSMR